MIPLMREKYALEYEVVGSISKQRYRKLDQISLKEKRIFGILTAKQVGFIPNVQISFTEDKENFNRDTYIFKSLPPSGEISFNPSTEIYRHNGINSFLRSDLKYEEHDQFISPGTINQIETFHEWIITDLF